MSTLASVHLRGTRAAQPGAATVPIGTLYFVTDENITERSSGSTWQSYSATVGVGKLVQVVNTQTGAVATGTTVIPADDSIPQIGEGTEFMTLAITPTSATNKLKIEVVIFLSCLTGTRNICAALFQDATANALACGDQADSNAGFINAISFTHYMTAGTTSATTFRVRAGVETSGTVTFNGSAGARVYGGVLASSITISEIVP